MKSPRTRQLLACSVGLSETEVVTQLDRLKDLQSAMATVLMEKTPLPPRKKGTSRSSPVPAPRQKVEVRTPPIPSPRQSQQHSPIQSPTPSRRTFMEGMSRMGRDMRRRLDFKETGRHRDRSESKSKSPGARTGTSVRGSSKTHTLCMELERAMNCLSRVKVDPKATSYKRLYGDLRECKKLSDKHLNHDDSEELDVSYTEDLTELVLAAEEFLNDIDEEGDKIEAAREKQRQISRCLPKTQPQKWDGTINDFMRFKAGAQTLIDNIPDSRMALNAILDTIADPKLRRSLTKYKTPEEALKSLELQFGNPELSGPKIINDLKSLPRATSTEAESALILKIKEHYTSLTEINQQSLLGRNELFNLCHKLEKEKGQNLLDTLLNISGEEVLQLKELRRLFFEKLDHLYTRNTIWSRTDVERDRRPREAHKEHGEQFKGSRKYTGNRRTAAEPGKSSCKICKKGSHASFQCREVANMDVSQVKKLELCPHCLLRKHDKECPHLHRPFVCQQCKLHRNFRKLHINCTPPSRNPTDSTLPSLFPNKAPGAPQQAVKIDGTPNRRFQTKRDFAWRSEGGPLANPNPINSGLEMIDHVIIEAPNGGRRKVRVIHDQFGAVDSLSDISLESYSHRTCDLAINMYTATGSSQLRTDEMILKVLLADGTYRFIKTIAAEMRAQKAFTLQTKFIDLPSKWNSQHFMNTLTVGQNANIRCANLTEGHDIELLLGSDLGALAPVEIDRYEDLAGCVTLYESKLQNELRLLGGSRLVGLTPVPPSDMHNRSFRIGSSLDKVIVRRTITNDTTSPILFPENPIAKMSKTDQHFFKSFQDNNLLPPHPRACKGCTECPTCSDISAIQRRKTIEANLDKLCTLDTENPWPQGGWRIQLLWNSLKPEVPTNETDSVRRFLATERSLVRSPAALKTFNEQVQKCLDKGYFVLAKDYKGDLKGRQVSYLPLSYALKDTVEEPATSSQESTDAGTKTKARPVSDGSHRANIHTPSVNEALVPIPDLWTGKIQHLLLKFRTAQRLAIGDISQYYHRLRLDLTSVSMTRAIWREHGIGGTGELTTMIIPSASMGLTPVPALASHCRARTASMVKDDIAKTSLEESYVDDIYQPTIWTSPEEPRSRPEPDKVLIERIDQVEKALTKAQLQLGGSGWITDIEHDTLPKGRKGITGVTDTMAHRDVGVSTTGALGLRWNLGKSLPDGGTFSYRVHRPGSINLLPKKRGQRPPHGEMRSRADIKDYLRKNGLTKAGLLRLVMNLFDVLQLAVPWTATAKLLYREVLTENPGLGWKEKIPVKYFTKIENLATDLLQLSTTQAFPRRAVHMGPDGTIGHLTLILAHDANAESACVLAYIHQQWPRDSVMMPSSVTGKSTAIDETKITTKVSLLCGSHKLAEHGHEEQVASELLSATIAVRLKKVIFENSLVKFDKVIYLGDSFTVARVIRKNNRAYNSWAGTRVSFIQRNEDLDNMYHVPGKFLIPTADKGTRAHSNPSSLMDEEYWTGSGTIDTPLHLLPITPPSQYTTPEFDELPSEWLHKSTVQLRPVSALLTVTCHRVETESEDHTLIPDTHNLNRLKVKYRSFDKLKRIMMHILKMSPAHKHMSAHQLIALSEEKWFTLDYDILKTSLKTTPIPQSLLVQENRVRKTFKVRGRSGYCVPLLANPKKSRLTRVVLKQYHDENHCTSPANIQALLFKDFYVMGGAVSYIKKLGTNCPRCHLLRARPSQALAGEAPLGTQGPLPTDKSIWRRWMADICGPILVTPWSGKKNTRAHGPSKSLKHWILLTVDLCSRQLDAVLIEGYSAASVLTGMRELIARHGPPQHIYWDRASNLHAAAALFKEETEANSNDVDTKKLIKVQEELQRSFRANGITVHLSIPFSSHRQGRIEANVKRLKNKLVQLCYDESQTKLTPMEITSTLATACDILNQRPLLLTAESTIEEKNILCPAYLTCADLDLKHTSCSSDPDTHRVFSIHNSPLTRRATMIQERIERFRDTFNTFMTKSLTSLGKFNVDFNRIGVGDVCLILDKVHQGTLPVQAKQRYTLGVVEKLLSDRSFELRYARRSEEGRYKTFTCERSIQGLALIVRASRVDKLEEEDIMLDPIFPVENLLEQQNEATVNTPEDEHNETNMVESNNGDNLKGDDREDVIEETNTNHGVKSHVKKRPIMTVTFPKNVPQIKNIKRKLHN